MITEMIALLGGDFLFQQDGVGLWRYLNENIPATSHYCCPRNGLQTVLISTRWIMGNVESVNVQSEDLRPRLL